MHVQNHFTITQQYRWEMATSRLFPDWASIRKADDAKYAEAFARIGMRLVGIDCRCRRCARVH